MLFENLIQRGPGKQIRKIFREFPERAGIAGPSTFAGISRNRMAISRPVRSCGAILGLVNPCRPCRRNRFRRNPCVGVVGISIHAVAVLRIGFVVVGLRGSTAVAHVIEGV